MTAIQMADDDQVWSPGGTDWEDPDELYREASVSEDGVGAFASSNERSRSEQNVASRRVDPMINSSQVGVVPSRLFRRSIKPDCFTRLLLV
jgi:hypothetical protein